MSDDSLTLVPEALRHWADTLGPTLCRPDRPAVVLKFAMTLDGHIAVANGDSRWVSGEAARTLVHILRSRLGAVMVGAGTVLADDPLLTVRLAGWSQARRILVQGSRPWPPSLAALADPAPLVIATATTAPAVQQPDHVVWSLAEAPGRVDLPALLQRLKKTGTDALLLEGGSALNGAMLAEGLVDYVVAFVAPKLSGDGPGPVSGWRLTRMADALPLASLAVATIGPDVLLHGPVG